MKRDQIQSSLNQFKDQKILIIGDVMLDKYVIGDVQRVSPEAPVPVVNLNKRENRLGGAANVALNVKTLGAEPFLCAVIGDDENAFLFRERLTKRDITDAYLVVDSNRPTTTKTRVLGQNQHLLRIDEESNLDVGSNILDKIWKRIEPLLVNKKVDAVIFQDYDKGVLQADFIKKIIEKANLYKIKTFVDPKKRNFFAYKGASLFKPNFKEFNDGLSLELTKSDVDSLFKQAQRFMVAQGHEYLFVTLSEHGVFITDGKQFEVLPAQKHDISDVSGAGDTVISTIAVAFAAGLGVSVAGKLANFAAGIVCQKPGVVPISVEDLSQEVGKLW